MYYMYIFENKSSGYYFWNDYRDDIEMEYIELKYVCDEDNSSGSHSCKKSALYDDMAGYVDALQDEENLADNELYVVTYYYWEEEFQGLETLVDFGITKQEIVENVKAQKYVEGATYFTIGQMFHTTRKALEQGEF